MNWTYALLAGYIGAVIVIAVGMFRKKGWLGKISGVVVFMLAIIVRNLFDVYYLIPRENPDCGLAEEQQSEKVMPSDPAFRVIREQGPELTQKVISQAAQMKRAGSSEQQVIDVIQPQILQLQTARLQQAPSVNVVGYMKINLEQIAAVAKVGDNKCSHFPFPAVKGGINPARSAPHEVMNCRMASDMSMMRIAHNPSKHTVAAEEKQLALQDL